MAKSTDQKLELSDVKRLTDELCKSFSKITAPSECVKNSTSNGFNHDDNQPILDSAARLTWLFSCLASLSKRGLLPANLADTALEKAILRLSVDVLGLQSIQKDDCPLALSAGDLVLDLAAAIGSEALNEATITAIGCFNNILRILKNTQITIADPLMPGWVYQYLLHQSEKQSKKNGQLESHSAFYTQWFTPSWIAEFLVEDAIASAGQTFIDPACGAGHILVPALKRAVALLTAAGQSTDLAVKTAVEQLIFGLDIDHSLTAASSFSLYLACRDIDSTVKLDKASVFTVSCAEPSLGAPAVSDHRRHKGGKNAAPTSDGENNKGMTHDISTATKSVGGSLCLNIPGFKVDLVSPNEQSHQTTKVLPKEFGSLAANPPYMSRRTMPDDLCAFLNEHYPLSKHDLYSAFVELSIKLLKEDARASLICQQSVLSISRFKPLRKFIERESHIETIVQLGSGSFPTRAGEKVNNAIITFRRASSKAQTNRNTHLQFARILYPEEKKQAEVCGIKSMLDVRESASMPQNSASQPTLAPWCPTLILELFEKHPPLQMGDVVVVNGLFTCNNKMFVRKFNEVPEDERHEYVPYDKGGGQKWYHSTPYLLHWQKDGDVIRDYRVSRGQSRSLPGEDYYFKPGITYSYIGTQGFKARLLSPDCIFDIASSSVFTPEPLKMYMLGFMNSSLVRYLMGVLNPTINFQIGDLRRIPYAQPDATTQFEVSKLAQEAVDLARKAESLDRCDLDAKFLDWARSKERTIQSEIDRLIFALYKIPPKLQKQILQDPWVVRGQKNVFAARARR